jgi:hypothetical protein
MNIRKVTAADLKLGMLLPWDVYGENGALLIRKGHMIASANQIAYLVERGVFEDGEPASVLADPPSVLRKLNAAYLELHTLLQAASQGVAPPDFRRKLDDIALLVHAAIDLNVDIATASILHNQQQAPYAARHSVNTAIVAVLLARARQRSRNDVMTVTLAALTMNTGMLEHHQRWHDSSAVLDAGDHARKLAHPSAACSCCARPASTTRPGCTACCIITKTKMAPATRTPRWARRFRCCPSWWRWPTAIARVSERTYRPTMSATARCATC